jgi:hypothetical protein
MSNWKQRRPVIADDCWMCVANMDGVTEGVWVDQVVLREHYMQTYYGVEDYLRELLVQKTRLERSYVERYISIQWHPPARFR